MANVARGRRALDPWVKVALTSRTLRCRGGASRRRPRRRWRRRTHAGPALAGTAPAHSKWTVPPAQSVFNVQSYGAKGDGVADDTVAIRRALTVAQGAVTVGVPGAAVYFPEGEYVISAPSRWIGSPASSTATARVSLPPMGPSQGTQR